MIYAIYTCLHKLSVTIHFWFWRRTHTMKDFDRRMIELGCTKVRTRNATVYTTPNNGKIVVTDDEVVINPK